ncbi:MAG: hypothetical protein Ct9H300mP19_12530 [Dehalococcoidia bacterium]|nr:MAG: hypothetical protein Ct9H300mP19_12530 [Dehalococcoidia bacterium]
MILGLKRTLIVLWFMQNRVIPRDQIKMWEKTRFLGVDQNRLDEMLSAVRSGTASG